MMFAEDKWSLFRLDCTFDISNNGRTRFVSEERVQVGSDPRLVLLHRIPDALFSKRETINSPIIKNAIFVQLLQCFLDGLFMNDVTNISAYKFDLL